MKKKKDLVGSKTAIKESRVGKVKEGKKAKGVTGYGWKWGSAEGEEVAKAKGN